MSNVPEKDCKAASRASHEGISRWFVGSSRIKVLAFPNISLASVKRVLSPPLNEETNWKTSSPQNKNLAKYRRRASSVSRGEIERISSSTVELGLMSERDRKSVV